MWVSTTPAGAARSMVGRRGMRAAATANAGARGRGSLWLDQDDRRRSQTALSRPRPQQALVRADRRRLRPHPPGPTRCRRRIAARRPNQRRGQSKRPKPPRSDTPGVLRESSSVPHPPRATEQRRFFNSPLGVQILRHQRPGRTVLTGRPRGPAGGFLGCNQVGVELTPTPFSCSRRLTMSTW